MFRVFTIGLKFSKACFFFFIFFASLCLQAEEANSVLLRLRQSIQMANHQELSRILRESVGQSITLQEVQTLAREEHSEPLLRAVKATQACLNLDARSGMTLAELLQIAFFIETKLASCVAEKKFYLKAKETGLARTIEYDPATKYRFIHLEMNNVPCIGGGAKKLVTKSILYDENAPEVLARCEQTAKFDRELKITKRLQGLPGIVEARAYTDRVEKGVKYHTLFCKLYQPGTIADVLNDASYKFTLREKLFMALNIVRGLEGMQKKRIAHKDLHIHNYLVNIKQDRITGQRDIDIVIADLGCANFIDKTKNERVQGDSAFTAPEGFLNKMKGKDYYRTDLFAVGCLLYRLFYEKRPSWQESEYPKHAKTAQLRYRRLFSLVDGATRARRIALQEKGALMRPKELFELLILQMVHPSPQERPSATQARKKLERLLKRVQNKPADTTINFNMHYEFIPKRLQESVFGNVCFPPQFLLTPTSFSRQWSLASNQNCEGASSQIPNHFPDHCKLFRDTIEGQAALCS